MIERSLSIKVEENTLSKILTNILNTNDLYMDLYFTKKGTKNIFHIDLMFYVR